MWFITFFNPNVHLTVCVSKTYNIRCGHRDITRGPHSATYQVNPCLLESSSSVSETDIITNTKSHHGLSGKREKGHRKPSTPDQ